MSSTKRGGGGGRRGRGRGRGRGAVAENDMDHLETSAPSSPSTTSDREENAIPIPRQSPACYVGPSELSSTLLNPKINHRSDAIFGDQAVEQLKLRHHKPLKFHERYRPYLRDAGLLGLSQICQKMPQLDKALITALVERWRPETHSFHLASGEITITLQDVAMLFALPIDGRPVCSTTDHDYGQVVLDCFGLDARGPAMPGKSFLHYKWLKKNFYELPDEADDMTVERHVRAYILSLLCGVLFPDGTGRMSLIYLPLIADLSRVSTYSWGSAVLAFLYRSLCSVASSHNIKNIGGSLLLLQLWSWERFHVGRPLVRSPCTETGIEQDLPPIGFRWVGARTQSDNATRSLKQYRDELNLQRVDQVKWEPYLFVESSSLPPLCTRDSDLWLTQAPLINFPIVEMYLPERVMRQFSLRQCVPPPFRPTLQSLHRISRRGRERENWEETHHEYIQEWEARRQRIFRDTEQYDPSSYEEYLNWYSGATRRYLVPATSDDAEAGPLPPPGDSLDLQNQAKSPLIRKAVDKLEGMVKKAKRAMTSTADTTTQALVAEFLHGFQDVLQDLSEIDTSPHVDAAELLHEAEQNIDTNQEDQEQEDEELDTVEHASLSLEPMDEENNLSNNVLTEHHSLGVEENCDSAAPATGNYDTATAATELVQPSEDLQQDEHLEDHPEMDQTIFMVEPKCEEDDGSNFVLPSSPPELMLEEQDDSANPAEEQGHLAAQGTESCTVQQSLEVGEAEGQENLNTAEHDGTMVEHTGEENNNCNGVPSSCPASSALVDPIPIEQ
ncbi:serine/threonine-protein phosphatase 7 long form homolog [Setaria viridis]|uniref:serine/threonine-protein phosphatase 7 long form homolog n=1 Tax=Setaria viridis TaxID=4556 RepID=UPI0014936494|nr:serine/threonine-protein phosphatase 7 long form homolog [Setaria viridis]